MRGLPRILFLAVVCSFSVVAQSRGDFDETFSASNGTLSASAEFKLVGSTLTVTITNTSTNPINDATGELLGIFFNAPAFASSLTHPGTITPQTAYDTNGNPLPNTDIGLGWAYSNALNSTYGATSGIQGAGYGVGNPPDGNLFSGSGTPVPLDGANYGIAPANYNFTGNPSIATPIVLGSLTATFTVPSAFDASAISNVTFQYGTKLSDGHITSPVPSSIVMLGTMLIPGLVFWHRRRKAAVAE
jgi:hypothetical protein